MFFLVEGDDEYRIALKRDELKALFLRDGDAAVETFDGKDSDFTMTSLFQSVSTLSFFEPRKIVVIEDAGELINSDKNFLAQKPGLKIFEDIVKVEDDICVIFTTFEKSIAKNTRIYKIIEEHGKIFELKKFWHDPNEGATGEFRRWVESEAKKRKLNLTSSQISILVTRVGSDLRQISNELDKIALYFGDDRKSSIDDSVIRQIVPASRELVIFTLTDAIAQKNVRRALAYLNELLTSGEADSKIVTMIHRNITRLYKWQILISEGKSAFECSKELGLSNFQTRKLTSQVANFPISTLPDTLNALIRADEEIKSSTLPPNIILEKLIIRLAG